MSKVENNKQESTKVHSPPPPRSNPNIVIINDLVCFYEVVFLYTFPTHIHIGHIQIPYFH